MSPKSNTRQRALVTGIGVLSPVGLNRQDFTESVVTARSGISEITAFDTSPLRTRYGGEIKDFDPGGQLTDNEMAMLNDRYLQLALFAAREALDDAGLSWSRDHRPLRTAIVVGTCNGGLKTAEKQYSIILGKQSGIFDHQMNRLIRYHTLGKALSFYLGNTGPTWVVTTACSSSTAALAMSLDMIDNGLADTVLAGGADALCLATMAGFNALKATSTDKIAPFSMPSGLNLGEGAAFWVVENEKSAFGRGAKIEGELRSACLSADAYHPTSPDPRGDGAYRTMQGAMERAGVGLPELGCINAHGTGTDANDRTESKAITRLFGNEKSIPVYSFKSQIGHCLGAAGILEATAGLVAMQADLIPATINYTTMRPGCGLDYVPNTPRPTHYSNFMSCNYAFGGNNAAIVVGKYLPKQPPPQFPVHRTVLTGAGAVTSLGLGTAAFLAAMTQGRRGLSPVEHRVNKKTKARFAGLVDDFNERDIDRRLNLKLMNLISRYATAAARLTLKNAGLRIGPREGNATGIINGVYVGPSEEDQMRAVISSNGAEADIANFSQVVVNATAGWVSNALLLKGHSTTLSQGADSGLFALLAAHFSIRNNAADRILAGAADEVYSQYFKNYDALGYLHTDTGETNYRIVSDLANCRVLGEGAAYVLVEQRSKAIARGATNFAELVGYGIDQNIDYFDKPSCSAEGVAKTITDAINSAGWQASDVGMIIWTPQGNSGDLKTLDGLELALGDHASKIPLLTSVFHTGLLEASSGTATLGAVLEAWATSAPLWRQMTGITQIDERFLPTRPVPILTVSTSELGSSLALAVQPYSGSQ
jgi:3-oxoacyl-[acyl-carrier-protein] synthase II